MNIFGMIIGRRAYLFLGFIVASAASAWAQSAGATVISSWYTVSQNCWWEGGEYDHTEYDDEGNEVVFYTPYERVCDDPVYTYYQTVQVWAYGLDPSCTYEVYTDTWSTEVSGSTQFVSTDTYCLDYEQPPSWAALATIWCPICDPANNSSATPGSPYDGMVWNQNSFIGGDFTVKSQPMFSANQGYTLFTYQGTADAYCRSDRNSYGVRSVALMKLLELWYGSDVIQYNGKTADIIAVENGEMQHYADAMNCSASAGDVVFAFASQTYGSPSAAVAGANSCASQLWSALNAYAALAAARDASAHPAIAYQIIYNGGY